MSHLEASKGQSSQSGCKEETIYIIKLMEKLLSGQVVRSGLALK